jgi:peptide/nickel transport system permease protein
MLEVLNENYIRTAEAYGLSPRLILYKYALKNGIIPTIAVLGVGMGAMLSGAIYEEIIFNRTGLGRLIFDALVSRNYTVTRGGILVASILFVLANLVADLSYRFLDPRIQAEEELA